MKPTYFLILALFAIGGTSCNAQTLHVRLLNGKTGKPLPNAYVNVWVGDQRKDAVPIVIDSNGEASLSLTNSASDPQLQAESVHSPTFLYSPEIRVQVGFVLCQVTRQKYSWLHITPYSTTDWVRTGLVTSNACGKSATKPEPGVLTIFARPLSFWETLSQ